MGFTSGLEGLAARGGLGLGGGVFEFEAVLESLAVVAGLSEDWPLALRGVLREAFRGRLETGGVALVAFFRRAEFCGRVLSPNFLEEVMSLGMLPVNTTLAVSMLIESLPRRSHAR